MSPPPETTVLDRKRRVRVTDPDGKLTRLSGSYKVRHRPDGAGTVTVELVDGRGQVAETIEAAELVVQDRKTALAKLPDGTVWRFGCTCGS